LNNGHRNHVVVSDFWPFNDGRSGTVCGIAVIASVGSLLGYQCSAQLLRFGTKRGGVMTPWPESEKQGARQVGISSAAVILARVSQQRVPAAPMSVWKVSQFGRGMPSMHTLSVRPVTSGFSTSCCGTLTGSKLALGGTLVWIS
jgi:hypothetical protein